MSAPVAYARRTAISPSAYITTRKRASGVRYVVRFRRGGRYSKLEHAGSFKTRRHAQERMNLVAGWLAAGLDPTRMLAELAQPKEVVTFAVKAREWLATRIDLADSTRDTYGDACTWIESTALGKADPAAITTADIQKVISTATLEPTSLQTYMSVVKQTLDFCGRDPNPARGGRVKLPRQEREEIRVPTAKQVEAIIRHARPSVRLVLQILAATGMRIGELLARTWGDVDITESRLLVVRGKTRSATRWVAVPEALMDQLLATVPPDDRARERRLFDFHDSTVRNAMLTACISAGTPHYSPHDLRHRYISVLLKQGVSRAEVARQVGHVNTNELATYEHVVLEDT